MEKNWIILKRYVIIFSRRFNKNINKYRSFGKLNIELKKLKIENRSRKIGRLITIKLLW